MAKAPGRVVLDTNVLVSSFLFGGNPRDVLFKVITKGIVGVTSPVLLAELIDTLGKKFEISQSDLRLVEAEMRDNFEIVYPAKEIFVVRDVGDNKVLEAAIEGKCDFIVTGDKDLLSLKEYGKIRIVSASEFLEN